MSSERAVSPNCSCKTKLTLAHINADKLVSSFASLPAYARYILIFFTPSPTRGSAFAVRRSAHHTSNKWRGRSRYRTARYLPSELISERSRNEASSRTCYFYVQPSESTRVLIAKSCKIKWRPVITITRLSKICGES